MPMLYDFPLRFKPTLNYCPYCSACIAISPHATMNAKQLTTELECYSCKATVRGYQLLLNPISLITLAPLFADQDRYRRFLVNYPLNAIAPELDRVKAYLTACILGEA